MGVQTYFLSLRIFSCFPFHQEGRELADGSNKIENSERLQWGNNVFIAYLAVSTYLYNFIVLFFTYLHIL